MNWKQAKQRAKELQAQFKQSSPTAEQQHELGLLLFDLGEWEKAIAPFTQASQLDPKHWLAHYHWGMALFLLGQTQEAIAQFQTAVRIAEALEPSNNSQPNPDNSVENPGIDEHSQATRHQLPRLGWATALICEGKRDEAIAQLEAALDQSPEDFPTLLTLLSLYRESRRARFAQMAQAEWEAIPSAANLYRLGLTRQVQKEHQEVLRIADQGLADYPEVPWFYRLKAQAQAELKQPKEAIVTLEEAQQKHPKVALIVNNLAALYQNQKRRKRGELIQMYEKAIALDPTFANAHHNLGNFFQRWRFRQGVFHHLQAIRLNPLLQPAYRALSCDYTMSNSAVKKSIRAAQYSLKLAEAVDEPTELKLTQVQLKIAKYHRRSRFTFAIVQAPFTAAIVLMLQGVSIPTAFHTLRFMVHLPDGTVDSPKEEAFLQNSLERYPKEPLYRALQGDTFFFEQDRPQEAKQAYQQAVELAPKEAYYRLLLSQAEVSLKNYDSAVEQLQQAIALDPNDPEYRSELVRTLTLQGKAEAAADQLNQAIAQKPNRAETYLDYGEALWEVDRDEMAIAQLQKAIELDPNQTRPYYYLGLSLGDQGRWGEAVEAFQAALNINPDLYLTQTEMGVALSETGQFEQAIPHFRHSIELESTRPSPYVGLAEALEKQGDREGAIANYQTAKKLHQKYGQSKAAQEVQKAIDVLSE